MTARTKSAAKRPARKTSTKKTTARKSRAVAQAMVLGWDFSGDRLRRMKSKKDQEGNVTWEPDERPALPFNLIPTLIVRDEAQHIRAVAMEVVYSDGQIVPIELPSALLRRGTNVGEAFYEATGLDLQRDERDVVLEFLNAIVNGRKARRVKELSAISEARWNGDELQVPGPHDVVPQAAALRKFGDRADVDEADAKKDWREIVGLAIQNPKFALVLGMPLGSLYVSLLRRPTFALHVTGDSHQGKTEGTEIAMNTMGLATFPDGPLYRTWNGSARSFGNVMKAHGILPLYLDDTAAGSLDDDGFTQVIFELAQGKSRMVAGTDGRNVDDEESWYACVLSSGEASLSARSNLGGVRRRVMELRAPMISTGTESGISAEDAHWGAVAASRRAHGWPLFWLAADPALVEVDRYLDQIGYDAFSRMDTSRQLMMVDTENIATCLAGFVLLGRMVGMDVLRVAQSHARHLATDFQDRATEHGENLAARAVQAIVHDLHTRPNAYPNAADDASEIRERRGVVFDDDLATIGILTPAVLREIVGVDADTVLEALKRDDRLVTETSRTGFQKRRRVWMPGETQLQQHRMYVVKLK